MACKLAAWRITHTNSSPRFRCDGIAPSLRRGVRCLILVAILTAGCDRYGGSQDGVIDVFGGVGLGPGAFSYPRAITVEPGGGVFVVDKAGRIQRFSRDGAYETEWRMPGTDLGKPVGIAVHPDGRIFVADTHYSRVMIFDRDGKQLGSFGSEGNGDGEFQLTTDVAFDAEGFIYVSEYHLNDRITKWSPALEFAGAIGDDLVAGERLRRPAGMEIDDEQTLWVADACNHRIVRFSLDGEVISTIGRFGRGAGELRYPFDVDVTPEGEILVCEYGGDRLQWFSKDGRTLRIWGRSGRNAGELSGPWGAACGPRGRVYVVDSLNSRVQIVEP